MRKNIGKICNASDAYIKVTQLQIVKKVINTNIEKQSDYAKPKSSKSSKSTKTSKAASITKLQNDQIKMKKHLQH